MWLHYLTDGSTQIRTGEVWDRGPSVDGAIVTAWAIPDAPLATDAYCVIAVGKANRRQRANGSYSGAEITKGITYSSDYEFNALGSLTRSAAAFAQSVQRKAAS